MGDMNLSPPSIIENNNRQVASLSAKIMVIAMIVLFFIVTFCFFLSIYARWYWSRTEDPTIVSWRRRAARETPRRTTTTRARARGLDRATLRSLPIMVYDKKDFKEALECSVCLSEISLGEKVRLLPKCNHGFHVECIDMWFKSHTTCPLCRNLVVSSTQDVVVVVDPTRVSSDSDSDTDTDNERPDRPGAVNSGQVTNNIPTNVLIWGANGGVTSPSTSSSSDNVSRQSRDELVIEVPSDLRDDCSPSTIGFEEEEAKTPVVSRLKSLTRLLSRGKRVAPWASSSGSADSEHV